MLRNRLFLSACLALGLTVVSACTPEQQAAWSRWHEETPAAAEQFAIDNAAQVIAPAVRVQSAASAWTVWDQLAQCESGGNWAIDTGNGFYGGVQFTLQSWRAVGGSGYPNEASREEQIERAERLLAIQGWGAWPGCARKLGLR